MCDSTQTTAPEPSTYFDHLSKIAAGKRSQRSSLEPPPREIKIRHCLHCGYDRLGLPDSLPCPECGQPFDFDDRQAICADLARKPLKLWWQLLIFRPPPVGWWEVFDRSGLHKFTPFRTAAIVLLAEDQDWMRTRVPEDEDTVVLTFPLKKGELEEAIERLLPTEAVQEH